MSANKTKTKAVAKACMPPAPPATFKKKLLLDADAVAVVQGFFACHTQGLEYEVRDREYSTARAGLAGMLLVVEALQALADAEDVETT